MIEKPLGRLFNFAKNGLCWPSELQIPEEFYSNLYLFEETISFERQGNGGKYTSRQYWPLAKLTLHGKAEKPHICLWHEMMHIINSNLCLLHRIETSRHVGNFPSKYARKLISINARKLFNFLPLLKVPELFWKISFLSWWNKWLMGITFFRSSW